MDDLAILAREIAVLKEIIPQWEDTSEALTLAALLDYLEKRLIECRAEARPLFEEAPWWTDFPRDKPS